jgi:hypothetical protein
MAEPCLNAFPSGSLSCSSSARTLRKNSKVIVHGTTYVLSMKNLWSFLRPSPLYLLLPTSLFLHPSAVEGVAVCSAIPLFSTSTSAVTSVGCASFLSRLFPCSKMQLQSLYSSVSVAYLCQEVQLYCMFSSVSAPSSVIFPFQNGTSAVLPAFFRLSTPYLCRHPFPNGSAAGPACTLTSLLPTSVVIHSPMELQQYCLYSSVSVTYLCRHLFPNRTSAVQLVL